MKVLVTGGAGYIGSHTCVELLKAGHEVFVIDNLCNGHEIALDRVRGITNQDLRFINADIRDLITLDNIFNTLTYSLQTRKMNNCLWFKSTKNFT